MERQGSAAMSRAAFAAVVIGSYVLGAAFLAGALLVFSGAVDVAGMGEGTVVQRIVAGGLALVLGGVTLAAATMKLRDGPGAGGIVVRRAPFWTGVGTEEGYGDAGFGVESRADVDRAGAHPGVGEF
ncbi:hypothetical protein ACQPZJ_23900 [Actinoplanes sp. CA-054009]